MISSTVNLIGLVVGQHTLYGVFVIIQTKSLRQCMHLNRDGDLKTSCEMHHSISTKTKTKNEISQSATQPKPNTRTRIHNYMYCIVLKWTYILFHSAWGYLWLISHQHNIGKETLTHNQRARWYIKNSTNNKNNMNIIYIKEFNKPKLGYLTGSISIRVLLSTQTILVFRKLPLTTTIFSILQIDTNEPSPKNKQSLPTDVHATCTGPSCACCCLPSHF